ncbi:MAG TPA: PRC-barrel domain-containing protein, partial [Acidobacteriota bacterium]|nr:PRC-barrel domain-containing protein [Acidobacteriota bacterium]
MNSNLPLLNARQLETTEVRARDGTVGRIDDLLFDDATWTVRYVVVDTGVWLAGRRVLLAPHAIEGRAEETNCVSVNLTQEQIRHSPEAKSDQVTREHEARLHEHYRWPLYWAPAHTPFAGDAIPPPAAFERPAPRVPPAEIGHDPHLRSARHVRGYRLAATDGSIGVLEDLLLEPKSWRIAFLIADTNGWLPGGK